MALRFIDSFDHYTDVTTKYTTSSYASPSAGNGRNSTASMRLSRTNSYFSKTLDSQTTWIVGVAIRLSSIGYGKKLIGFLDGGGIQCDLRVDGVGVLTVTRNGTTIGTGSSLLINTWYYIEFKLTIDNATGVAIVMVNGQTDINLTGIDTQAWASATANVIYLGGAIGTSTTENWDFDDLYVCDGTGAAPCNDFLGDCRVEALLPSGAGANTVWTPSAGANYACVDDNPPNDDTDYVSSSNATDKDTYALGNLATTAGTVYGVQTVLEARKDDAGTRTVKSTVLLSATESNGANANLGDTYAMVRDVFEAKPGGGAWTVADVNNAELGMELVA